MSHALLSPSSASRWLVCTKSARLEETFPDSESVYAKEGSLAHSLAELTLKESLGLIDRNDAKKEFEKIKASELYSEEMYQYCLDYHSLVISILAEAHTKHSKAIIYLEQKFDLSAYIEEGFGTCDAVIIADHTMHIIDLKYGKGVPVSAIDNKQLRLYALGAYLEFEYAFDIREIKMTIVQPRLDSISTDTIIVAELIAWAGSELKMQAAKAFNDTGEFIPGNHCQFCRAKPVCKAHHDNQLEIAKYEFAEPALLDDEQISAILDRLKSFEDWIEAVKEYTLDQALKGKQWPGYKLVEGRSNRKYSDEDAILEELIDKGYTKEEVGRFKLLTITEMEKLLGKKAFANLIGDFIIKPPGKPKLAPITDIRPAINTIEQAQKEFDD